MPARRLPRQCRPENHWAGAREDHPGPGARNVDPIAPVLVKAETGTLAGVEMVNEGGTAVQGVMTPTTWCGNPPSRWATAATTR